MASKEILLEWVKEALYAYRGSAKLIDVAKHIWENHERELRASGDLFYSWQYDMRWAAYHLRKLQIMKPVKLSKGGKWELADASRCI